MSSRHSQSEETRAKISISLMNHIVSEETRAKISISLTGRKQSKEVVEKRRISQKKYYQEHPGVQKEIQNRPEVRVKKSTSEKLAQNRPEVKKKRSASLKKVWQDADYQKRQSASRRIAMNRPATRAKNSSAKKKSWQNPKYREKQLKAIFAGRKFKPSKLEKFLDKLLQKLFPNEYKYVGDGELILGGKCPDFMNVNGQKKLIEAFGDYWHGQEFTGVLNEQHEQERKDIFKKFGYQTLIIWEHELKDIEAVTKKILEFHRRTK